VRAQIDDIYDTYRADGAEKAMQKFMAHAGLGGAAGKEAGALRWEPSPEEMARMRVTTEQLLAHLIRPTTRYPRRAVVSTSSSPRTSAVPVSSASSQRR